MFGSLSRPRQLMLALVVALVLLALIRRIDHDESQYVAAAVLSAGGHLPYRDFAYLQTPLQPLLFAPVTLLAGSSTWLALRLVNAVLGAVTVAGVFRAARLADVGERVAIAAAALFAASDVLLFSVGTARNDALPAALLASALPLIVRAERGEGSRSAAAVVGLLLAAAAAAKLSYLLPALAYGGWALFDRRRRGGWVMLGALPAVALVIALAAQAPEAFRFEVIDFPTLAPQQYYVAAGRAARLGWGPKLLDTLKFLALGGALLAIGASAVDRRQGGARRVLELLALAGLVSALLPSPVWRQYLLPMLPPLFVRLALAWQARVPTRVWRIAAVVFASAGLAPTVAAAVQATGGVPMLEASRDAATIKRALDAAGVSGPVATLSPQYLPGTGRTPDPRFAAGPFYFRSNGLIEPAAEHRLHLLSRARLDTASFSPGQAVLVGGEALSSGDAALDRAMAAAAAPGAVRIARLNGGRWTLYVRP